MRFVFSEQSAFLRVGVASQVPLVDLRSVETSTFYDGVVVIRTAASAPGDKGDHMFDAPHLVEFVSALVAAARNAGERFCRPLGL